MSTTHPSSESRSATPRHLLQTGPIPAFAPSRAPQARPGGRRARFMPSPRTCRLTLCRGPRKGTVECAASRWLRAARRRALEPCCAGNGCGAQMWAGTTPSTPLCARSTGRGRTCSDVARSARPRPRRGTTSASGSLQRVRCDNEQAAGRAAALEAAAQAPRDLAKGLIDRPHEHGRPVQPRTPSDRPPPARTAFRFRSFGPRRASAICGTPDTGCGVVRVVRNFAS